MIARDLGKTHHELMTGRPGPLTSEEFQQWNAFYAWEAREKKRAMDAAARKR